MLPTKCARVQASDRYNQPARYLLAPRQAMRLILPLFALAGFAACGGRVELPAPGAEDAGIPAPASSTGQAGSVGKGGVPSSSLPSHELGVCKPGFDPASDPRRACNWLNKAGMCFSTRDEACACVCPLDHDSVCWSPFPGGTADPRLVQCD